MKLKSVTKWILLSVIMLVFSTEQQALATIAPLGSIGDLVWSDNNGNGQQDTGELGIQGVLVTLNGTDVFNNPVRATQTTGATGDFLFTGLLQGSYMVTFGTLPDYVRTVADTGADATDSDANPTTGQTAPITLAAGENKLTVDAGLVPLGSIGDLVWNDFNHNGIQDLGEPGISGVEVTLAGPSGPQTATTDLNGLYQFGNLIAGTYTVTVGAGPAAFVSTLTGQGTPGNDSNVSAATVVLAAGDSDQTIDFGFFQPATIPLACAVDPAVETVCAGTAGQFSVVIDPASAGNTGYPPYSYVWYWVDPSGDIHDISSTFNSYDPKNSISTTEPRNYAVIVTDAKGQQCTGTVELLVDPCQPGATCTIGYWQTHFKAMQAALAAHCVDLGVLAVAPSGSQDLTHPSLGEAEAIMWGKIGGRCPLGQARMQLGQQLIGAMINVCLVGTTPMANGFSPTLLADARSALDGTNVAAILSFVGLLDAFNNSGDALPLDSAFGPAEPKAAKKAATSPGPAFN